MFFLTGNVKALLKESVMGLFQLVLSLLLIASLISLILPFIALSLVFNTLVILSVILLLNPLAQALSLMESEIRRRTDAKEKAILLTSLLWYLFVPFLAFRVANAIQQEAANNFTREFHAINATIGSIIVAFINAFIPIIPFFSYLKSNYSFAYLKSIIGSLAIISAAIAIGLLILFPPAWFANLLASVAFLGFSIQGAAFGAAIAGLALTALYILGNGIYLAIHKTSAPTLAKSIPNKKSTYPGGFNYQKASNNSSLAQEGTEKPSKSFNYHQYSPLLLDFFTATSGKGKNAHQESSRVNCGYF